MRSLVIPISSTTMHLAGLRDDNTPSASLHTVLSCCLLQARSISQLATSFQRLFGRTIQKYMLAR